LDETPRVSALIVSYNTRALVLEAIGSVAHEPGVETIVLDNASRDGSARTQEQRSLARPCAIRMAGRKPRRFDFLGSFSRSWICFPSIV
jgi:GT2 family glycosyltransferase